MMEWNKVRNWNNKKVLLNLVFFFVYKDFGQIINPRGFFEFDTIPNHCNSLIFPKFQKCGNPIKSYCSPFPLPEA